MNLDDLGAAVALELDALCDDFERRWRRARRRGEAPPDVEAFAARVEAGALARRCLSDLQRDLSRGVALPSVPGLSVEEEIGRGGMGVVYRARRGDGRAVALKLIAGDEHARLSRWAAELAGLSHPNLLPLEEFGRHQGLHYVVMPLAAGGDLRERRGEFAGDTPRVARLMARVADAVAYLHVRGVVHRDLKPSNVLLTAAEEPLVCDFGLAEWRGDAAADVASLGAMLGELAAGGPLAELGRRCLDAHGRPSAAELAEALGRF